MRKIKILIAIAALCSLPACAQTRVMKVVSADGSVNTYKVANVQEVRFEERVVPTLHNQYAVNEEASDIQSVTREIIADGNRFEIFGTDVMPLFTAWVSSAALGKTFDLAEASPDNIRLTAHTAAGDIAFTQGTLRVGLDKFGKNLSIDFTGENGNDDWGIKYQGAFTTVYAAAQSISLTPAEGDYLVWPLGTVLCMPPGTTGENTRFVFASGEGSTAAELTAGECCVWLSLPASAISSGKYDLSKAESYALKLYRYAHSEDGTTFTLKQDVVSGSVTYTETEDYRIYIKIDAQFADGTRLETEYYGEPTATDNLDGLEPRTNGFTHLGADGNLMNQQAVTGVEYRIKGTKTNYYFMYEGADETDERGSTVPLLILPESMSENGTYQLAEAKEGFEFKYNNFQLAVGQWRNQADNGTLTIERDGEGNISIAIELVNTYTTDMGSSVIKGGTPDKFTLYYKGKLTER